MSTRTSRTKKPQNNSKIVSKQPTYATIEQLNNAMDSVKAFIDQNFKDLGSINDLRDNKAYQHAESLHASSLKEFNDRHAEAMDVSKKHVNTLIGINGAVTGSMNVMQRLPSLMVDQTRATRSVASGIGTIAFILLATEVVVALAVFAFIYLK